MAEKMAERIAEILKGPNFQTAEKALTDFCGTMDGEFRNILVDIIVERWIDTPKDVPFSYARSIWNRKDIKKEENPGRFSSFTIKITDCINVVITLLPYHQLHNRAPFSCWQAYDRTLLSNRQ